MSGGTLLVSRARNLFPRMLRRLAELGFRSVEATAETRDSLNAVVCNAKPRLVLLSSFFYQAATPYLTGELLRNFPRLNVAAVAVHDYPLNLASWFVFHGAKSYLNLWEGYEEFHRGLQLVREGEAYISPEVQKRVDLFEEFPDTNGCLTKRLMETLLLLCAGYDAEHIGEELHIAKRTVHRHLERLYSTFHVNSREEMVALAWQQDLVTKDDLRFHFRGRNDMPTPQWARVNQIIEGRFA